MGKQYSASQSSESRHYMRHHRGKPRCTNNSKDNLRTTLSRLLKSPEDLDVRGLGSKLCEVLGIRSGDRIEFHVLADGSVRIINYGNR
jgi:hypothetical protein